MDLPDLLEAGRISCHCDIQSKKRTLQTVAELLGRSIRDQAQQQARTPGADSTEADPISGNTPETSPASAEASGSGDARSHEQSDSARNSRSGKKADKPNGQSNGASANDEKAVEELSDMDVLDALICRERLGSTGLGHGVALPHSRLPNIKKPIAALITLNDGVDFEAADGEPVDLVVGLLVPQECNDEHLKILASLARRFSDSSLRDELRSFTSSDDLLKHLKDSSATP